MTPTNKPQGDTMLQATIRGNVCQEIPVIIIAPYKLKPSSSGPEDVAGVNKNATKCTSPAYWGPLGTGKVYCCTVYGIVLPVTVLDQFNNPLDAMYNDAPVFEKLPNTPWRTINLKIAAAKYLDPVGDMVDRPPPPAGSPKLASNSEYAQQWPSDNPENPRLIDITQNIGVQVAGVDLDSGVVNRKVKVEPIQGSPGMATVTITWS